MLPAETISNCVYFWYQQVSLMDRQQLVDMQRGFAEIHQFELNERRMATPAMRMRQLDAIWSIAGELGISCAPRQPDPIVRDQWAKLRKAVDERNRTTPQ